MRYGYIRLLPVSLLFIPACNEPVEKERPNIIILQLDDLGLDDLGINGNEIVDSKWIDSFGKMSARFSDFYVNPVCAPTRASLLTGRHFLKTGVSHVHGGKDYLNLAENTIADILKENGYATGMWGKWHSGKTEGYFPWQRGFDEAYMARLYKHRNSEGLLNGEFVSHSQWADRVICDYATSFIRKNSDRPFFAYLSFLSIHSPLDAPAELVGKYLNKGLGEGLSTLYAMVENLDNNLEIFFNFLESERILENTVIFFLSDNGPAVLNNDLTDEDRKIRYVNHMKGHKGNIWENGVKSPLFVYLKGRFEDMDIPWLADVTDILPTIIELTGSGLPGSNFALDGKSFVPELEGKEPAVSKISYNYANRGWPPTDIPWTPEGVLDEYRPVTDSMKMEMDPAKEIISVRTDRYKLMFNPAAYPSYPSSVDNMVLIDMDRDPLESENIVAGQPEVLSELKESLDNWFSSVTDIPVSFKSPVFNITASGGDIPACGAAAISPDLENAYNFLSSFSVGTEAVYSLNVYESGDYLVEIIPSGKPAGGAGFRIIADADTIDIRSETASQSLPVHLDKGYLNLRIICTSVDDEDLKIEGFRLSSRGLGTGCR